VDKARLPIVDASPECTGVGAGSWSRSAFHSYSIYGRPNNDMGDWVKQQVGEPQPPEDGEFVLDVVPGSVEVEPGGFVSATVKTSAASPKPPPWSFGAPVPYPVQRNGTELLLEFIGESDAHCSAPASPAAPRPDRTA
jgi:hypothetical protein